MLVFRKVSAVPKKFRFRANLSIIEAHNEFELRINHKRLFFVIVETCYFYVQGKHVNTFNKLVAPLKNLG